MTAQLDEHPLASLVERPEDCCCDRCGPSAQAVVCVQLRVGEGTLAFCGHHWNAYGPALLAGPVFAVRFLRWRHATTVKVGP